jgi:hypothetical protein
MAASHGRPARRPTARARAGQDGDRTSIAADCKDADPAAGGRRPPGDPH